MRVGWVGDCSGEVYAKAFGCAGALDLAVDVRDDFHSINMWCSQKENNVHPIRA